MTQPTAIWIMGRSGAGKTTLAAELAQWIPPHRTPVVLDTDQLRGTLNADLGWGHLDRHENVRRYAELANYLANQTIPFAGALIPIVVCSTPLIFQRVLAKRIVAGLKLIHLQCPLDVARARGPLYAKLGQPGSGVTSLAGVNSAWEEPQAGEVGLTINTATGSALEALSAAILFLRDAIE